MREERVWGVWCGNVLTELEYVDIGQFECQFSWNIWHVSLLVQLEYFYMSVQMLFQLEYVDICQFMRKFHWNMSTYVSSSGICWQMLRTGICRYVSSFGIYRHMSILEYVDRLGKMAYVDMSVWNMSTNVSLNVSSARMCRHTCQSNHLTCNVLWTPYSGSPVTTSGKATWRSYVNLYNFPLRARQQSASCRRSICRLSVCPSLVLSSFMLLEVAVRLPAALCLFTQNLDQ